MAITLETFVALYVRLGDQAIEREHKNYMI
jgi:hypothetical protein